MYYSILTFHYLIFINNFKFNETFIDSKDNYREGLKRLSKKLECKVVNVYNKSVIIKGETNEQSRKAIFRFKNYNNR